MSSCKNEELKTSVPFNKQISSKWKCISVTSGNSGVTELKSEDDFIRFDADSNHFEYLYSKSKPELSGSYSIVDSSLHLVFLNKYQEAEVDSSVFKIINNVPYLILYNQGDEITRFEQSKLAYEPYKRNFKINKLTTDSLILSDRGVEYLYINTQPPIITDASLQGGFSIIALLRGLLGMAVLLLIAYLFSTNRKAISWKAIIIGLTIQIVLALSIIYVPPVQGFFEFVGSLFVKVLDFTKAGSEFLLGGLLDSNTYGFIFVFQILPTIIFFSALTSVLFYLGIIQKVVYGLAWVMSKLMKLSGAESLSVAGNIFLGQTESPLMIKAYLDKMNKSEILLVMIGGMATVAGGVLAAYIDFLGGKDPIQRLIFAKHLLAASIMAAPGAIVISKILVPQTEKIDKDVKISKEKVGSNILDAMSLGTIEGLKLAANVGAMLLVFFAFIAMINFVFLKIGDWSSLNESIAHLTNGRYSELSLQFILGYALSPLMWIIGVCSDDITLVGQLLGEKLIA
ncbi:MAG: hypothetical protein C0594_07905, partial [Marinilabiliales bacterium]